MEQQIRTAARKYLPDAVRRPLGSLAGKIDEFVYRPLLGLIFDLKGSRFRADGCTFKIPKDVTTRSWRSCFLLGTHEIDERILLKRYIRPEDRVIELGACLGIVSCLTNKLLADKSAHVVVEANPLCIHALYTNRELNNARFLIEHCAASSRPEVTFYLHPKYIVGGSLQRPTDQGVLLPAKSLRQLEQERGPFTALIIDIEGSEREVFEESTDLLKRYRLVMVELHDWAIGAHGVERCRTILRECGLVFAERSSIVEVWQRQ